MIRYRPIKMRHPVAGYTYGVICEEQSGDAWRAAAIVPDVSCDWLSAARLAERCTRKQAAPLHLLDMMLDACP